MRKRSFKNRMKSMFGIYIDPDKDDEIKWSYIEMEEKYKKIIEILKDEDMTDRQKVVEMIEDFHKHHQSVYERYDHITGELKEKVHLKKEKDSSSSSSSSDSDSVDNFAKKGSKNGKLKVRHILKERLQAANAEIDVLTEKLKVATDEKEAFDSELKLEADRLHEENIKLSEDNKNFILKFENFKGGLQAEFSKQVEELKAVIVRLEGENSGFNSDLSRMKEKLELTEAELTNVNQTLEATELLRNYLSIKSSEFADDIKTKDEKLAELATECSQLRENLADKEKELLSHMEMHTSHKSETEIKMRGYEENFESLSSQKREIEIHKNEEKTKLTESVSNLQKELESLNVQKSKLEEDVNEKQEELETKSKEQENMVEAKEGFKLKVKDLELQLESITNFKNELEIQLEKKRDENVELVGLSQSLKSELESKSKDQTKAVEEKESYAKKVDDLEKELTSVISSKDDLQKQFETEKHVYLQLQNQLKDKIQELETTAAEKEEKLVSKISTLSETIAYNKETEENVKKEITQKLNEISGGMDSLTVKLEEDHRHILTRIFETMNEIQVSKISIKNISSEKDSLKEKTAKMIIQLNELETETGKLTNSVDQLQQKTVEKDEKIKELETQIIVKNEGLQDLGEEKREVIRQLCMLVDYQRDRYCRLQELLVKKTAAGRR